MNSVAIGVQRRWHLEGGLKVGVHKPPAAERAVVKVLSAKGKCDGKDKYSYSI